MPELLMAIAGVILIVIGATRLVERRERAVLREYRSRSWCGICLERRAQYQHPQQGRLCRDCYGDVIALEQRRAWQ